MPIRHIFKKILDIQKNVFSNSRTDLSYVVESKDWAISYVGKKIVEGLKETQFGNIRVTTSALGLKRQIVHFGSLHTLATDKGFKKVHSSNKIVLTWFHFVDGEESNKKVFINQERLQFIHTACNITKQKILDFGIGPSKVVMIPLGVDLRLFSLAAFEAKQKIRMDLGIPQSSFVIGSFQKDGVGWGDGREPKLIKGPDIFVKAVEKIASNFPVFVLLTGPARGYVKAELNKRKIPYKSIGYLDNFEDVAKYYKVLDLYIVASRIEGGPQAILESMASGVPLISTKVGMAPDVIIDGENGFLTDVEDIGQIVQKAKLIIENQNLRQKIIANGLKTAKDYSWAKISQKYLKEIYLKLT
ncbi:MAG: glycosyltransferase family 4 protein [Candidatus Pacebacteria bacterium]|nr:glycosyltransferase family 4 protein [Candidatus Paceibacterota bacterium]